ncbi:CHAT domain-containing protein [Actinomadura scrupuli]|uniref:CHAT domain-containing protein n=1 Tax=Actinomadura scrupuli TaxID=559629 RepID=UPI003D999FEE
MTSDGGGELPWQLGGVIELFARQGNPEHDQGAAERIVALAERYLRQMEHRRAELTVRACVRIWLANGLTGPMYNGAHRPELIWDVQRAIGELNRAVMELRGSGADSLLAMAHEALARTYQEGNAVGPIHLYEPLAIRHGERAVELTRDGVPPALFATARQTLAIICMGGFTGSRAERIDRAIALLEEASDRLGGEVGSELWCNVLHNLGESYTVRPRGDYEVNLARALECYERVATAETEEQRPGRWAQTQVSIGMIWFRRDEPERALTHLERARRVYENARGRFGTGSLGGLYRNMSMVYGELGDTDRQVEFLRKILDGYSGVQSLTKVRTQTMLAAALRDTDQAEAGRLLREGLAELDGVPAAVRDRVTLVLELTALATRGRRPARPDELVELVQRLEALKEEAWDDPRTSWAVCDRLGRVQALLGRWADAADAYVSAVDRLELNYRAMLLFRSRGMELAATVPVRHNAAYALARAGKALDAVAMLQAARARLLGEVLERDLVELERVAAEDPAAHRSYLEAAARIRAVEVRDRASGSDDILLRSLAEEAHAATAALEESTARIRGLPGHADFLTPPASVRLRPGQRTMFLLSTAMGSMVISADDRGDGPVATAVSVEGVTDDDVMAALGLDRKSPAVTVEAGRLIDAVEVLGASFAEAMGEAVGPATAVTLVPCGPLGLLPLHLIQVRRDGWQRRLIDACVVDYALVDRPQDAAIPARPVVPMVAVSDPGTDLVAAEDEVRAIRAIQSEATLVTGVAATKANVLEKAGRAGLIHFACHSDYDPRRPYESGLHLADGALSIGELMAEHPPRLGAARLVVLSSCESAVIDPSSPDQVIGLPAALACAGAGAVIGTLWRVSDAAAAVLMGDFYARLDVSGGRIAAGEPPRALRESQRWLRGATAGEILDLPYVRSPRLRGWLGSFDPGEAPFASARHWAPFVVLGA